MNNHSATMTDVFRSDKQWLCHSDYSTKCGATY